MTRPVTNADFRAAFLELLHIEVGVRDPALENADDAIIDAVHREQRRQLLDLIERLTKGTPCTSSQTPPQESDTPAPPPSSSPSSGAHTKSSSASSAKTDTLAAMMREAGVTLVKLHDGYTARRADGKVLIVFGKDDCGWHDDDGWYGDGTPTARAARIAWGESELARLNEKFRSYEGAQSPPVKLMREIARLERAIAAEKGEQFDQHLQHASEVTATWPAWKQRLLGGKAAEEGTDAELPECLRSLAQLAKHCARDFATAAAMNQEITAAADRITTLEAERDDIARVMREELETRTRERDRLRGELEEAKEEASSCDARRAGSQSAAEYWKNLHDCERKERLDAEQQIVGLQRAIEALTPKEPNDA